MHDRHSTLHGQPAGESRGCGALLHNVLESFGGVRAAAAVCALSVAIAALCPWAPSKRSRCSRYPPSSTTAILTFHLFFSASTLQAATIFCASAALKHDLFRTRSPFRERLNLIYGSCSSPLQR